MSSNTPPKNLRRIGAVSVTTAILSPLAFSAGAFAADFDDSYTYDNNPGTLTLDVLSNDENPSSIILSASSPSNGSVSVSDDGRNLSYTPNEGFFGGDNFTYTADNLGVVYTASVSVEIKAPVAAEEPAPVVPEPVVIEEADPPVEAATPAEEAAPLVPPVEPAPLEAIETPSNPLEAPSEDVSTPTAPLAKGAPEMGLMAAVPAIEAAPSPSGSSTQVDLLATTGPLQPFSFTFLSSPSGGYAYPNDPLATSLTYVSYTNFSGSDIISYEAISAEDGSLVEGTIFLQVTPVGQDDTLSTEQGDAPLSLDILGNDYGSIDYGYQTYPASFSLPENGIITYDEAMNPFYTPNSGFVGTELLSYQYYDTSGQSYNANLSIEVSLASPVITADEVLVDTSGIITFRPGDNDFNVDAASINILAMPALGTLYDNGDGSLSYYAPANFSGIQGMTYEIYGTNGERVVVDLNLHVLPVAAADGTVEPLFVEEDTPTPLALMVNDQGSLDMVEIEVVSLPLNGSVSIEDGQAVYTPDLGFKGTDSFTYRLRQPGQEIEVLARGTLENGFLYSEEVSVNLAVAKDLIEDDFVSELNATNTGESTTINFDSVENPILPGSFRITDSSGVTNGTLVVNPDGVSVTFTPNSNFSGANYFSYQFETELEVVYGDVTLDVNPVGVDDIISMNQDTTLPLFVLGNDRGSFSNSFPFGGNATFSQPSNGTITPGDFKEQPTYTPNPGFTGLDTFSYEAFDSSGQPLSANVSITVNAVVPFGAVDDEASVVSGASVDVNVALNDGDTAVPGSAVITTAPVNGQAVLTDGILTYTPNGVFSGTDTVEYEIFDEDLNSSSAIVTFSVTPQANDDSLRTLQNTPASVDILSNDFGSINRVEIISTGIGGTASFNPDNPTDPNLYFTPDLNFAGPSFVTYRITDTEGQVDEATVAVEVAAVMVPPVVTPPAVEPVSSPLVVPLPSLSAANDSPARVTPGKAQNLPQTGSETSMLVGMSALFLAVGAALTRLARRSK